MYAIKSGADDRIYVGMSMNIEKRLKEHNSGMTKSTKLYGPWKIIFTEKCENWESGRQRGKYYKSGAGKEFLKRLVP